jgi:hypothetical protein
MFNKYISEILEGIMISDGHYSKIRYKTKKSYLVVRQTKSNVDWLNSLKQIFENNDIVCSIYPYTSTFRGKTHLGKQLQTRVYAELGKQRERWYPKGKKIIPKDIKLTPVVLAHWYMGDGSLYLIKKQKKGKHLYKITLCTECFTKKDIEFLRDKLKEIYGWFFHVNKSDKGFRLVTSKHDFVKDFLFRTYPYMVDCFGYKWDALNDPLYDSGKKRWSNEQLEILRRDYEVFGTKIPSLLKSRSAIKNMAVRRRLKHKKRFWTEEMMDIMKEKFPVQGTDIPELIEMGKSPNAIQKKAGLMGLKCKYNFNQFGKRKWKK